MPPKGAAPPRDNASPPFPGTGRPYLSDRGCRRADGRDRGHRPRGARAATRSRWWSGARDRRPASPVSPDHRRASLGRGPLARRPPRDIGSGDVARREEADVLGEPSSLQGNVAASPCSLAESGVRSKPSPAGADRALPGTWFAGGILLRWPSSHRHATCFAQGRSGQPLFRIARPSRISQAAGLSRAHFSREFRRAFGESPHAYLLTRRLERAAALLRTTDRSVADVCFSVGLRSVGSFTTSFTRTYGVSERLPRELPPGSQHALVPTCVPRTYGRPRHRTFREDKELALR